MCGYDVVICIYYPWLKAEALEVLSGFFFTEKCDGTFGAGDVVFIATGTGG